MKKYANKTVLAAEKLLEKDPTCCYNAAADREQNYLGKKIAQARAEAGLSLNGVRQLLAVRGIRVGVPAINKWEQGETVPNAYQLMALAELLGVEDDLTYFMSSSPRAQLNREGLRKVAAYRDDLIASGRYRPQEHTIAFREMPVSYLSASAGTGQFLDEGNFELLSFPDSYIPEGAECASGCPVTAWSPCITTARSSGSADATVWRSGRSAFLSTTARATSRPTTNRSRRT